MKPTTIVWLSVLAAAVLVDFTMIWVCFEKNCLSKEIFDFLKLNILVLVFCAGLKLAIEFYETKKLNKNDKIL